MDKTQKREEIKACIKILSNEMSKENYHILFEKFRKIYDDDFRHFYSDISVLLLNSDVSRLLQNFNSDTEKNIECINLDLLAENMRNFYEYAEENKFPELKKLDKLNDHITMDIARINYWKKLNESYSRSFKTLSIKLYESKEELKSINEESKEVKKDLISIMGIFMGVFSFIQWNFSQYRDLLEYDPFNRILYILAIDSVLILSLYCVFAMIDFIVHKEPRMAKPFLNLNTKKPTIFGIVFALLYLLFLFLCVWGLNSDSARKTISKIETEIENIQIENRERTDTKIESLKLEMEKINQEHEAKIEEVSKKMRV